MSFLQIVLIAVFVFHNYIHCSTIPLILTARDSLTTEIPKWVEIVTPVPNINLVTEDEIISTKMPSPPEIISNLPERSHFPTEMPMEMTTLPMHKNKTEQSSENKVGNRMPKFLGRLALLAGLRLAEELTNGASSINLSTKESPSPISLNSSPTRLSPYIAAVYEPFSFLPAYFYSNLFNLLPFYNAMNPQKVSTVNNIPNVENLQNSQQIISTPTETDSDVSADFQEEYVMENKREENTTMQGRKKVALEGKEKNPSTEESTTSDALEEENEEEEVEENEEEDEQDLEPEDLSVETFAPTKAQPSKKNKISPTPKPARQMTSMTTKKPTKMKKTTTKRPQKVTPTMPSMNDTTTMNSTDSDNSTDLPVHNNTEGYPYPGYYGGFPQNIHDVYLTSSENPHAHENYNYNDHIPHFSEEWSSNRIHHDSHYYGGYPHLSYDVHSNGEGEPELFDERQSFRGSPSLESATSSQFLNSGFRPSYFQR